MKRHVFAGLLAVAAPSLAHAQASLPPIGWSVSSGHSARGSKICTLFGGFGNHSGLAWVADGHNPPQHFTLFFDDGGVPPRPHLFVSQLMVAAPGSQPLFMSGTVSFGQFRTTLDRESLDPLLHLFAAKRSMTVALEGDEPVTVNLQGSADAAQDLRRCASFKILHHISKDRVRVAAARHHGRARLARAARRAASAQLVAFEPPLPDPPPAPPPVPAPAVTILPAVLKPPVAAATAAPAPPPAAPVLPPPAPTIAPAVLRPPVAPATALPNPPSAAAAQLALDDTALLAKAIEDQFTDILQDGKVSYQNTGDKDLSLGARATRATDLCILLGNDKVAIDWTGTISNLSNSSGQIVLAVKLADGITVGTTGGRASDSNTPSGIDPASDLLPTISQMHVGEHVRFSGRFFPSDTDCIEETSPTLDGSMTSPNFLMQFTAVGQQS
jgi:hypothetical protein